MTKYSLDSHHTFDGTKILCEYMILRQARTPEEKDICLYAASDTPAQAITATFPELVDVAVQAMQESVTEDLNKVSKTCLDADPYWATVHTDELDAPRLAQVNHVYNENCFQNYSNTEIRALFGVNIKWGVLHPTGGQRSGMLSVPKTP